MVRFGIFGIPNPPDYHHGYERQIEHGVLENAPFSSMIFPFETHVSCEDFPLQDLPATFDDIRRHLIFDIPKSLLTTIFTGCQARDSVYVNAISCKVKSHTYCKSVSKPRIASSPYQVISPKGTQQT